MLAKRGIVFDITISMSLSPIFTSMTRCAGWPLASRNSSATTTASWINPTSCENWCSHRCKGHMIGFFVLCCKPPNARIFPNMVLQPQESSIWEPRSMDRRFMSLHTLSITHPESDLYRNCSALSTNHNHPPITTLGGTMATYTDLSQSDLQHLLL